MGQSVSVLWVIELTAMKETRTLHREKAMSKKKATVELLPLDQEIVLSCAMRYAIGRKTYVVASVCSELRLNYNRLPLATKGRIAREIQEYQNEHGMAGMDFDNDEWNKVKWLFDEKNRVEIKAQHATTKEWTKHVAAKGGGKYWSVPEMLEYHTVKEIKPR